MAKLHTDEFARIGAAERLAQDKIVDFISDIFGDKEKCYLGNLEGLDNNHIRRDELFRYLTETAGYSVILANKAIDILERASDNMQDGLYAANKEVYRLLRYGAKVSESADDKERNVYFIDFEHPERNHFAIAEEVTIIEYAEKRPDAVIYINGIAVVVLELKKATVSVADGIRQNITNQSKDFIPKFFSTVQLCMAANSSEGLRYGTVLTPEPFYLEWHEDCYEQNLDELPEFERNIRAEAERIIDGKVYQQLYGMLHPLRLLTIIHDFIIFDSGIKKVARYNQYFAVRRAQTRIFEKHEGGIIWNTQGSGKSLSMVWLSKWLLEHDPNARVLIITDREELDEQIELLYSGVQENIVRTVSGKDMIKRINKNEDRLICSLVQKFKNHLGEVSEKDFERFAKEVQNSLPKDFIPKGNVIVFVDECHRTQSGRLHAAMKTILKGCPFVGFTGTPLEKKNKPTSLQTFGSFIHVYTIAQGIEDKVIVDLRYDPRDVEQTITSQKEIDRIFDTISMNLSEREKALLKQKWAKMSELLSSKDRLKRIAADIIKEFTINPRLNERGNAILVADSIENACRYYEIFKAENFDGCAIITSFVPLKSKLRTEAVEVNATTGEFLKFETYRKMLSDHDFTDLDNCIEDKIKNFEDTIKDKFIKEPAQMRLLIVVNKLLTGFDAPRCTYLFIDRKMEDVQLFQAVCRVNRVAENKDFGVIVDYKELFGDLADAVNKYADSCALSMFDKKDIEGLLVDYSTAALQKFNEALDEITDLCQAVPAPRYENDYITYFCAPLNSSEDDQRMYARLRNRLYRYADRLHSAFADVEIYLPKFGYSAQKISELRKEVDFYLDLKLTIARASSDFIDMKQYAGKMRWLIDNYISADVAKRIIELEDLTLMGLITEEITKTKDGGKNIGGSAETIERNIHKEISVRNVVNPAYYNKMSDILVQLVEERKLERISYKELLEKYKELAYKVQHPEENPHYPQSIRHSEAMRALFDNCGENEALTVELHKAVMDSKQDGFHNNPAKINRIKRALYKVLHDDAEVERVFSIVIAQREYR